MQSSTPMVAEKRRSAFFLAKIILVVASIFSVLAATVGFAQRTADTITIPTNKDARLKPEEARKLAFAEAKRRKVPAGRLTEEPEVSFMYVDGVLWWNFHFAAKVSGPGKYSDVLVNDRTREVRFMGGL